MTQVVKQMGMGENLFMIEGWKGKIGSQRGSTAGKVLVLNAVYSGYPGISLVLHRVSSTLPRVIPEHKARSKPCQILTQNCNDDYNDDEGDSGGSYDDKNEKN